MKPDRARRCRVCGETPSATARFCRRCGARLSCTPVDEPEPDRAAAEPAAAEEDEPARLP